MTVSFCIKRRDLCDVRAIMKLFLEMIYVMVFDVCGWGGGGVSV
jgi:hypothetical protein